jgi:hypothetical protein
MLVDEFVGIRPPRRRVVVVCAVVGGRSCGREDARSKGWAARGRKLAKLGWPVHCIGAT